MEGEKNKRRREKYVAIEPGEDREGTIWKNEQFCGEEESKGRHNHEVQKQLRVTDKKKMNKDPSIHKERQEDQEPLTKQPRRDLRTSKESSTVRWNGSSVGIETY